MASRVQDLRRQVEATESELRNLKVQLHNAELEEEAARQIDEAYRGGFPADWIGETLSALHQTDQATVVPSILHSSNSSNGLAAQTMPSRWPLADDEYKRYGRQLIMPEVGLHGQLRLKNAKVLIVGVGGLGCPAAAYLCGAGVGTLGLVDGDTVEASNLHRQIVHATTRVGMSKVDSACEYLQSYDISALYLLNPILIASSGSIHWSVLRNTSSTSARILPCLSLSNTT